MKRNNFFALLMGTISMLLFALGMCMVLLPEWNVFSPGVIFSVTGLAFGLITFYSWCKAIGKKLPRISKKALFLGTYMTISALALGVGMSLCLVWSNLKWGIALGSLGIIMLVMLIPILRSIK